MSKGTKNTSLKGTIKDFIMSNAAPVSEIKYAAGDSELVVKVVPTITLANRTLMINNIISGVFTNNDDSIDGFTPEYLWFLKKFYAITSFTDFAMPTDIDDIWLVISGTSLYKDVYERVGEELQLIFDEVDMKIEARKQYLANKTDINSFLTRITKTIETMGADMKDLDMEKFTSFIQNLQQGMKPEDLVQAVLKTQDKEEEIKNN